MTNRSALSFGLLAMILYPAVAFAQNDHCGDKNNQTDMNICSDRAADRANRKMEKTYSALLQRYRTTPDAHDILRRTQEDWVKFRKDECALEGFATLGGTVNSFVVNECYEAYAQDRLKVLKSQLSCDDSELDCIIPPDDGASKRK
jgi:uncharacterized protein YecT (DUF1311 family)